MPVILPRAAYDSWLAGDDVPPAPYTADAMTAHPVSTRVNRPTNNDPRCAESFELSRRERERIRTGLRDW